MHFSFFNFFTDFVIFQVVKWMFLIFHDFQFSCHIPHPTVDIVIRRVLTTGQEEHHRPESSAAKLYSYIFRNRVQEAREQEAREREKQESERAREREKQEREKSKREKQEREARERSKRERENETPSLLRSILLRLGRVTP